MRPALSRSVLNRAAHRRNDPQWLELAWTRARVLVVDPDTGHVPVSRDPTRLVYMHPDAAPEGERLFLGGEDEPYFAVAAPVQNGAGLREIGVGLSDFDAGVLAQAVALVRWHRSHRRSPADGQPLTSAAGGWELRNGDRAHWPRTDPAVVVEMPDRRHPSLLARGTGWPKRRFSCIAGFVEPGESAEAACFREVREEIGLDIAGLSYVASQPWPFPHSLMLGYEAESDPDQPLTLQPDEIRDARWFTRAEVLAALAGAPGPLLSPPTISISRFLLWRWAQGPQT
jgi:NAD+ diphosphatase